MGICKAKTKAGKKCSNISLSDSNYCEVHKYQEFESDLTTALGGGAAGMLLVPGMQGFAVGAVLLLGIKKLLNNGPEETKVFISFDFDNDKRLKDLMVMQSKLKHSPFKIIDFSLVEAQPESSWVEKARKSIRQSDVVVVMLGVDTYRAQGVLKEVGIARAEGIPIVQIIADKKNKCRSIPNAGKVYSWNWKNLKTILGF